MSGYINTYTTGPSATTVPQQTCVDTCLQNHLANIYFYAISYYPPGSDCWCNEDSTFTGTQIPSPWITMIVWSKKLND